MNDPDPLLLNAAGAIRIGGSETLRNPPFFTCATETHEPFRLASRVTAFPEGRHDRVSRGVLWGTVSTSSWHYAGDRTDLHDVWSLCWAAFLRAAGLGSPWLVDVSGFCSEYELSARHLIIQPPWSMEDDPAYDKALAAMNAWSAFAYHLLDGVFDWRSAGRGLVGVDSAHAKPGASWIEPVLEAIHRPPDYTISRRIGPTWIYFSCLPRGVTIVRLPMIRMQSLRRILAPYMPSAAVGKHAVAVFANGIGNAVPFATIKLARRLLKLTSDNSPRPILLPIDSHCLYLGDKTLVAIRQDCGREIYEEERKYFLKRRSEESKVFFADSNVEWCNPLDAADFESLCVDLLRREPGVRRAKPVGGVNDRDGGRDILVDWEIPEPQNNKNKHNSF
jgi:hypothetical protein